MEVAPSSSSSTSAAAAPPVPALSSSQPLASSSSSSSSLASSSSSNNAATYRPGCKHLRNLQSTDLKTMLKRYALGVRWGKKIRQGLVQSLELDDEEEAQAVAGADDSFGSSGKRGKKRLLPHPLCSACYATLHKPYLCLSCGYAGCFYNASPSSPAAISQGCLDRHLASKSSDGHNFALEIHSGILYCHGCHGAVQDVRFDAIYHREKARVAAAGASGGSSARPLLVDPADEEEGDEDSLACTRMPQHPTSSRVPRGIHNLGATCFLSVILQSFVHNPVLRNYFLSDRHNADLCGHAAGGQSCVACEMDRLFRDFFSHDALSRTPTQAPSPWTPNSFLYTVWRAQANEGSAELSQAGQQDSHELFISVLNAMHTALIAPGSDPASRKGKVPRWVNENDRVVKQQQQQRDGDHHHHHHGHEASSEEGFASRLCDCIMHRTFSGILQSDVRCLVCGYRSSTHDPVLDLSVDLKAPAGGTATASGTASSAGGGSALDDADPLDLLEGPASKKQKKSGAGAAATGGVNGLKRDRDGSTPAGTTMKKTSSKTGNLLPPTNASPSRKPSPSADASNDSTSSPLPPAQDLLDCLRRYCTSERLPPSSYSCPQCGPVEASKQLSLRRLPPVLCIQLKRFEHHLMGSGWSSKVEARVRFPVRLDVREFVTPSVLESGERGRSGGKEGKKKGRRRRAGSESDEEGDESEDDDHSDDGNRSNDEDGIYDDDPLAIDDFLYTLFCVIVHEGTLNTGHYWCFAKWQDHWYRFNDAEAPRKCSVAEVVAQEKAVYQLVYVRRGLENVR